MRLPSIFTRQAAEADAARTEPTTPTRVETAPGRPTAAPERTVTPAEPEPAPTPTAAPPEAPAAPASPEPAPSAAEQPPAPAAAPPAAETVTPTRVLLGVGGLLTALSMVWTAWSIWDLLQAAGVPGAVAAAAAVGVELAWIAIVAVEWSHIQRTGRTPQRLVLTGWAAALGVVAVLVLHAAQTSWAMAPIALLPLAGKALWSWALAGVADQVQADVDAATQRRAAAAQAQQAATERAAELSEDLSDTERAEIAALRRQKAYVQARTEAELELEAAEAEAERRRRIAEHERRLEQLQMAAEEQMGTDRADADIVRQRHSLTRELELSRSQLIALPAGGQTVTDTDRLSAVDADHGESAAAVGFGAAWSTLGGEIGEIGPDQRRYLGSALRGGEIGEIGPDLHSQAPATRARRAQGARTRELILSALDEDPGAGARAIAARTGIRYETVRRYLRDLRSTESD